LESRHSLQFSYLFSIISRIQAIVMLDLESVDVRGRPPPGQPVSGHRQGIEHGDREEGRSKLEGLSRNCPILDHCTGPPRIVIKVT
jgi:hypothetical protein